MATQKQWRRLGAAVLLIASAMALYAVLSDVLRNSAMLVVALSSDEVAQAAEPIARWPLALFWSMFALLLILALYLAAIDIRYIRLQYADERRTILQRTLQDESFRKSLQKRTQPGGGYENEKNGRP